MPLSEPVDGFRLGCERAGSGPPAVLLHGWPGDRSDYRVLAPALAGACEVIVPDLRGPTMVLWPARDPLFPQFWSDRAGEFFSDITIEFIDGAGHFGPLEFPEEFAAAIRGALARPEGAEGPGETGKETGPGTHDVPPAGE